MPDALNTATLKRYERNIVRLDATPEQRFEIISDRPKRRPLVLARLKPGDTLWIVSDGTSPLYDPVLREYKTNQLLFKMVERKAG